MAELTKDLVLQALSTVNDPDLNKPLTELGMIANVMVCSGVVSFEIKLTTTACPLKQKIMDDATAAVQALEGVTQVNATFSKETVTLQSSVKDRERIPGVQNIIAISSGKGGVGKSTVTVNLACALAQEGARVGILDADIYGPNVPLMMGLMVPEKGVINGVKAQTQDGKMVPPEAHGVKVMSMAFLIKPEQPVVWRGPLLDKVIRDFMAKTDWAPLDYLLIDLPPGTGDAQLTIVQAAPLAGAIIVTTPQEVALHDSRKGYAMFKSTNIPVFGIVENMSYYLLPDGTRDYIFGQGGGERAANELDVDYLGGIPLVTKLRQESDAGRPIMIADPDGPQASIIRQIAHTVIAKVCAAGIAEQAVPQPAMAAV